MRLPLDGIGINIKIKILNHVYDKFKNPVDFSNEDFYIGLDVHKKNWNVTVRTSNLEVAHFSQLPEAKILFNHLKKDSLPALSITLTKQGFAVHPLTPSCASLALTT